MDESSGLDEFEVWTLDQWDEILHLLGTYYDEEEACRAADREVATNQEIYGAEVTVYHASGGAPDFIYTARFNPGLAEEVD